MKTIQEEIQHKIDFKTKPLGALGILENIALQIGTIQNTLTPTLSKPTVIVFAADHGITAEGVSPFPKEVTAQMVLNFLNGGAAINVFCQQNEIALKVVDAGVDFDFENTQKLIHAKIARGTKNSMNEPAMTAAECMAAIHKGGEMVMQEHNNGCNIIGFGEMGIGNTSAAALLMSRLLNLPIEQCTGRGTGLDDAGLNKKTEILKKVLSKHSSVSKPIDVLATFGGFEIAMMTGAMLKASELGMMVMVDGFIATSAFLCAYKTQANMIANAIFCHQSDESGHKIMLQQLGVQPILNLGMRLGEGTGAAVAYPIIKAAVSFLSQMASFESAGVTNK